MAQNYFAGMLSGEDLTSPAVRPKNYADTLQKLVPDAKSQFVILWNKLKSVTLDDPNHTDALILKN